MKTILTTIMIFLITLTGLSTNYYVNDNSTVGDVYCTAVGASGNNGTSKSTPKQTLTQINSAYTLASGDTVFVDAGTYTNDKALSFTKGFTIQGAGALLTIFDYSASHNNYFAYYNFGGVGGTQTVNINKVSFTGYSSTNVSYGSVIRFEGNSSGSVTQNLNINSTIFEGNGYATTAMPCVLVNGYTTFNMTGGGFLCNGSSSSNFNGSSIQISGTNNTVTSTITSVAFIGNHGYYPISSSTSQPCSLINLLANSPITQGGNNTFTINNCLFENNTQYSTALTSGGVNTGGVAIFCAHGNLNINSCKFNNNTLMNISAVTVYGGVVTLTGGTINIKKSELQNSSNISGSGTINGMIGVYGKNNSITLNIGASGDNTSGCYFSSNASNQGNDVYVKSNTYTCTVNGYYTNFLSSSSSGSIYSLYFNNVSGGSFTIANSSNPTTFTVTKTNVIAPPSYNNAEVPTYTGTCGAITLPIELLYFYGKSHIYYNELRWATASENNNDYFTIEKTRDGTYFYNVAVIKGAGNSVSKLEYQYIDRDIEDGINYYVLRQTDYDGKCKESEIISIDNRKEFSPTLIKVTNTLGQEVTGELKGVFIFHYSDGTTIKRVF
jgi:hypothetical protein